MADFVAVGILNLNMVPWGLLPPPFEEMGGDRVKSPDTDPSAKGFQVQGH